MAFRVIAYLMYTKLRTDLTFILVHKRRGPVGRVPGGGTLIEYVRGDDRRFVVIDLVLLRSRQRGVLLELIQKLVVGVHVLSLIFNKIKIIVGSVYRILVKTTIINIKIKSKNHQRDVVINMI